jgi:hypothetical protein
LHPPQHVIEGGIGSMALGGLAAVGACMAVIGAKSVAPAVVQGRCVAGGSWGGDCWDHGIGRVTRLGGIGFVTGSAGGELS